MPRFAMCSTLTWFSIATTSLGRSVGSSTAATTRRRSSFDEKRLTNTYSPVGRNIPSVAGDAAIAHGLELDSPGQSILPRRKCPG